MQALFVMLLLEKSKQKNSEKTEAALQKSRQEYYKNEKRASTLQTAIWGGTVGLFSFFAFLYIYLYINKHYFLSALIFFISILFIIIYQSAIEVYFLRNILKEKLKK